MQQRLASFTFFDNRLFKLGLAALLTALATFLLITFFDRLPIDNTMLSIDWHNIYGGIQNGTLTYSTTHDGLRNPPWSVLAILPLGWLSYRSSWALMSLITLAALIVSVPQINRRWLRWLSVLALISSYSALRVLADSQLEGLVIIGVLAILYAVPARNPVLFAVGTLLATAKPQETWLLILAAVISILATWPLRRNIQALCLIGLVVGFSLLWRGQMWLTAMIAVPQYGQGNLIDISLIAFAQRLAIPPIAALVIWIGILLLTLCLILTKPASLSRAKLAALICASILLSPYTSGDGFLVVMAIAVIWLLHVRWPIGLILLGLCDLQFILPQSFIYNDGASYTTLLILLIWAVLAGRTLVPMLSTLSRATIVVRA